MVHLDALWKMELAEGGITLITDEQFDFGLSSPSDSREEAPTEQARPVAHRLDLHGLQQEGVGCSRDRLAHWSPLSAEKLEEIMQEANRLAVQLERCSLREKEKAGAGLLGDSALSPAGESLAPVRLLHKERASPRSPRRETFVVKNSPVRALLPTVEPGMRLTPGRSPALCARAAPTPPHLRHRLGSRSAGGDRLHKKPAPSKAPAVSPTKRPQSSKKLSHQDLPQSRGAKGPRPSPTRPRPAEEPSSPAGRAEPQQEASAGQAKACGGGAPQLPASARPAHGTRASQALSHRLVPSAIPRPAGHIAARSRSGAPGRPSQLQPAGHSSAGRRGLPSAAGQRDLQRTAPPGSRLQPPRKVTLPSSLK